MNIGMRISDAASTNTAAVPMDPTGIDMLIVASRTVDLVIPANIGIPTEIVAYPTPATAALGPTGTTSLGGACVTVQCLRHTQALYHILQAHNLVHTPVLCHILQAHNLVHTPVLCHILQAHNLVHTPVLCHNLRLRLLLDHNLAHILVPRQGHSPHRIHNQLLGHLSHSLRDHSRLHQHLRLGHSLRDHIRLQLLLPGHSPQDHIRRRLQLHAHNHPGHILVPHRAPILRHPNLILAPDLMV